MFRQLSSQSFLDKKIKNVIRKKSIQQNLRTDNSCARLFMVGTKKGWYCTVLQNPFSICVLVKTSQLFKKNNSFYNRLSFKY